MIRHRHGLVETALYGIVVGMIGPLLQVLSHRFPMLAIVLGVVVFLPAPIWLAGLRYELPEKVFTGLVWHSTILWIALAIFFVGFGGIAVFQAIVG